MARTYISGKINSLEELGSKKKRYPWSGSGGRGEPLHARPKKGIGRKGGHCQSQACQTLHTSPLVDSQWHNVVILTIELHWEQKFWKCMGCWYSSTHSFIQWIFLWASISVPGFLSSRGKHQWRLEVSFTTLGRGSNESTGKVQRNERVLAFLSAPGINRCLKWGWALPLELTAYGERKRKSNTNKQIKM